MDEGSRCTDIDNEERIRLEKDIEVLQKRICEFEVYLMQMDAALGGRYSMKSIFRSRISPPKKLVQK